MKSVPASATDTIVSGDILMRTCSRAGVRGLMAACLLLTLACGGGDSSGPNTSLTGHWKGGTSVGGSNFLIDADLTEGTTVTGSGTVSTTSAFNCAATINGSHTGSQVNLSFTCTGYQPVVFTGSMNPAGTTVHGNIAGSGFPVTAMDLVRQ